MNRRKAQLYARVLIRCPESKPGSHGVGFHTGDRSGDLRAQLPSLHLHIAISQTSRAYNPILMEVIHAEKKQQAHVIQYCSMPMRDK
jgi:hypothetical protein